MVGVNCFSTGSLAFRKNYGAGSSHQVKTANRDKKFANSVQALLRREAAKSGGVGLSGNIIAGGYRLLVDELKINVEIICEGLKDSLVGTFSRNATNNFDVIAKDILVG